jgi:segregation and condensation protein A
VNAVEKDKGAMAAAQVDDGHDPRDAGAEQADKDPSEAAAVAATSDSTAPDASPAAAAGGGNEGGASADEVHAAEGPRQPELPFAVVDGEPLTKLPEDLYIPPDALEIFLEAFEGPLDLLLYLIKRQNLDILNIPIAEITRQYTRYIELMTDMQLELAGEYLVMAAMLAEIKSRMLLPRPVSEDADEDDPRAELVRRLQEYERYKKAAEDLDSLPRLERDIHPTVVEMCEKTRVEILPEVTLKELLVSFREVLARAELFAHHHVQLEPLSVRQRMSDVLGALGRLEQGRYTEFTALFDPAEGRLGIVVTFLALLELIREALVEVVQSEPYAPIHLKARAGDTPNADVAAADEAPVEEPEAS